MFRLNTFVLPEDSSVRTIQGGPSRANRPGRHYISLAWMDAGILLFVQTEAALVSLTSSASRWCFSLTRPHLWGQTTDDSVRQCLPYPYPQETSVLHVCTCHTFAELVQD